MTRLMRWCALLCCLGGAALAQVPLTPAGVPPGANPDTGARPGNVIGTGSSLPASDDASNIGPADTASPIAPNLPSPPIGDNATPRRYLIAARSALVTGHTGEAQQALEMAATRALDRSVPLFQTNTASADPLVKEIGDARQALGEGDKMRALQVIEAAIKHSAN